MPSLRTELTEIVTGLGMLGVESLDTALLTGPAEILNVTAENFDRLARAREAGKHGRLFSSAWNNGEMFASSSEGLRNRKPLRVEWKGSHKAPGYEQVPADLRVDYVYLVSCKYMSKVLYNASPSHLFVRLLATRHGPPVNWYSEVAPAEYQDLYRACRSFLGTANLPGSVGDLTKQDRVRLKEEFKRHWPETLMDPYQRFCIAVSRTSAARWQKALGKRKKVREETLWRLLRLQSAPYFILGAASTKRPMRYRVDTPWDFRRRYTFRSLDVRPDLNAGQPMIRWWSELTDKYSGTAIRVDGHVEVRWSHGRFSGAPEAKVYLDSPYEKVPGYTQLH